MTTDPTTPEGRRETVEALYRLRSSMEAAPGPSHPLAPMKCPQCTHVNVRSASEPCPACGWLPADQLARQIASIGELVIETAYAHACAEFEFAEAMAAGVFDEDGSDEK